jgi:hypothetical protein
MRCPQPLIRRSSATSLHCFPEMFNSERTCHFYSYPRSDRFTSYFAFTVELVGQLTLLCQVQTQQSKSSTVRGLKVRALARSIAARRRAAFSGTQISMLFP